MKPIIIDPLTYIFSLSLSSGKVPDKLKLAKVNVVYKSGQADLGLVANYRPTSLLSISIKS